jgi:FKBP-type peptidyl-prolyl cis-trans isomerase 2
MAGKHLHFKGVILKIRAATLDELVRKHYIQEGGVHRPDFGEADLF